jgi:hypothetical protein
VQRSGGDVYSTELECVVYGIDECDSIVRKDDDVIKKVARRCTNLGERRIIARREMRGGRGGARRPYGGDTWIFQPYQGDPTSRSSRYIPCHDNDDLVLHYVQFSHAESLVCDRDRSRSKWVGHAIVKVQ